jgi:hypothetical protein
MHVESDRQFEAHKPLLFHVTTERGLALYQMFNEYNVFWIAESTTSIAVRTNVIILS